MSRTSCEISLDDAFIHDHMHSGTRVMKCWLHTVLKIVVRRQQKHVFHTHKELKKLMKRLLCTEDDSQPQVFVEKKKENMPHAAPLNLKPRQFSTW